MYKKVQVDSSIAIIPLINQISQQTAQLSLLFLVFFPKNQTINSLLFFNCNLNEIKHFFNWTVCSLFPYLQLTSNVNPMSNVCIFWNSMVQKRIKKIPNKKIANIFSFFYIFFTQANTFSIDTFALDIALVLAFGHFIHIKITRKRNIQHFFSLYFKHVFEAQFYCYEFTI